MMAVQRQHDAAAVPSRPSKLDIISSKLHVMLCGTTGCIMRSMRGSGVAHTDTSTLPSTYSGSGYPASFANPAEAQSFYYFYCY